MRIDPTLKADLGKHLSMFNFYQSWDVPGLAKELKVHGMKNNF